MGIISQATAASDKPIQLNGFIETVESGGIVTGTKETTNDLVIPIADGGTQSEDDMRDVEYTRPNQYTQPENIGTYTTNQIATGHTIIHNGYGLDSPVQDYVQYAYDLGGMDLVLLMQCEQHRGPSEKSPRENSYGFCQINGDYYPGIINDPRFSTDRKREIQQCKLLRDNGTPFYGPDRPDKKTGRKCYIESQKRFTLSPKK